MAKAGGKRNRKRLPKQSDSEAHEIEQLDAAILAGAPPAGSSAVSAFDRTPPGQSCFTFSPPCVRVYGVLNNAPHCLNASMLHYGVHMQATVLRRTQSVR